MKVSNAEDRPNMNDASRFEHSKASMASDSKKADVAVDPNDENAIEFHKKTSTPCENDGVENDRDINMKIDIDDKEINWQSQ